MKIQLHTQRFMIVLALAIGVSAALADPVLAQQGSITMPHAGGITKPAAGGITTPDAGGITTPDAGGITTPDAGGITTPAEDIALYLPMVSGGAGISGEYFATLPPGSVLPGGAVCATRVQSRPENKGDNQAYNSTPGNQGIPADFFPSGSFDPRANTQIMVRVDGEFTGTTDEILQWAACKWGIDEDMVRAQAAIESWWHQDAMGDWTSDSSRCAPGHGLGVDGRPGQCPESFGILQNRYPYEQPAWPGIAVSTAFNADMTYAIWRACFEGYEWWLNDVEQGEPYAAGDAWGCFGRWFSGRWHTAAAEMYIDAVQDYLDQHIWETPNFQEP